MIFTFAKTPEPRQEGRPKTIQIANTTIQVSLRFHLNLSINIETIVSAETMEQEYITYLEEKLENTLSYVDGVGKIKVMVTVSNSKKEVVEKDRVTNRSSTTETDSEGGTRNVNNTESTETTLYTVDGDHHQK